ncbi:MAG TPA: peptidoglycan DD-metalloendopeptidase family protein [Polyangiales bacterium]|nr:peptidoglycan DD-metalloendopeptidase family protein [Polyangiales bacterium]
MRISGSVGRWELNAINAMEDVIAVQEALSIAARMLGRKDYDPGKRDGHIARPPKLSRTVDAILAFQSSFMPQPDGVISPSGQTLSRLRRYTVLPTSSPVAKKPATQVDAAPATAPGPSLVGISFPLEEVPKLDYHPSKSHKRWFGAGRDGRLHAACDLVAPKGTRIHAIADGVVTRGKSDFYHGTSAIEVTHERGLVARYCEIDDVAPGIVKGAQIKQGQVIAYVGKMHVDSMLHLELYAGAAIGRLSRPNSPPFNRRSDLIDPTPYLDQAIRKLPSRE